MSEQELLAWVKDKAEWWHGRSGWWLGEGCAMSANDAAKTAQHYDAIAALLEAKGWRDIATAPKDGTLVLLYDGSRVGMGKWQLLSGSSTQYPNGTLEHTETFGWFGHNIASGEQATHWMPLPTPPIPPLSAEDQR